MAISATATASQTTAAIANRSQIPIEKTRALQVTDNLTLYCISNSDRDVLKNFDSSVKNRQITGSKPVFQAVQLDMFVRTPADPNASEVERDWKTIARRLYGALSTMPKELCRMIATYLFRPLCVDLAVQCPVIEKELRLKIEELGQPVPEKFTPVPLINVMVTLPPPTDVCPSGYVFFYTQTDRNCSYVAFSVSNNETRRTTLLSTHLLSLSFQPKYGISSCGLSDESIVLLPFINGQLDIDKMILITTLGTEKIWGTSEVQNPMTNRDEMRVAVHEAHRRWIHDYEAAIINSMQILCPPLPRPKQKTTTTFCTII